MPKIVKSELGYWVGKELTSGSKYITSDNYVTIDSKKVVLPFAGQITEDIKNHLGVVITAKSNTKTFDILAKELCHSSHGMIYCIDGSAKHGVRKIIK